ncbi:Peptidyl-prolyl cis-trans isomerase Mip [Parachlamydia acanthamoebae]|nr:Peptidyl-prolyl cis-trans isomerase Mip [Parachlamydia acanthamoebae]
MILFPIRRRNLFMIKKSRIWALVALSSLFLQAGALSADQTATQQESKPAQAAPQEIDIMKLSEAFGNFIGRNLNAPGIKFDLESIIKGMRDGAANKPSPLTDQEYETMMTQLQAKAYTELASENLKAANQFLKDNLKTANLVEIEPGKLQYVIVEAGHEPTVTEHASPLVKYTGKYIDGSVFGSSDDTGGPITVPLDQTIPGFSKGILGMKEGEKRKLFVHPDLGYGTSGHLSPNSLLIFDVEVIKSDNSAEDKSKPLPDFSDENSDKNSR